VDSIRLGSGQGGRRGASGRFSVIEIQQATEALIFEDFSSRCRQSIIREGDHVLNALMISLGVVVGKVFADYMAKAAFAKQHEMLQAFFLDGPDEAFGKGIEVRGAGRQAYRLDACRFQQRFEGSRELGVPVVNQVATGLQLAIEAAHFPCNLFDPGFVRAVRDPAENHFAGPNLNEEQHIAGHQSPARPHFFREEVAGPQNILMPAKEIGPGRLPLTLAAGGKAMAPQDIARRLVGEPMPQVANRPGNPIIAPRRVIPCHADNQGLDFGADRLPSGLAPSPRAVELASHQPAVPSQDRLGFDDGDCIDRQFAKADRLFREIATLGVGQFNTPLDLVPEDAILLQQVFDPPQEVLVDRAGNISQHPLPGHGQFLVVMGATAASAGQRLPFRQ
jgi:hypothetical protein